MCRMTLTDYLKAIGDDQKSAVRFQVTKRRVESWRLGQRKPRPEIALRIVEATSGLVSLHEIYGPEAEKAEHN